MKNGGDGDKKQRLQGTKNSYFRHTCKRLHAPLSAVPIGEVITEWRTRNEWFKETETETETGETGT